VAAVNLVQWLDKVLAIPEICRLRNQAEHVFLTLLELMGECHAAIR